MKISAIVLSGIAGAKISSSGAKAVILRGGLAIAFKPATLPPWYDLLFVSDAAAPLFTAAVSDTVAISDGIAFSRTTGISDSASAAESFASVFNPTSNPADVVSISETFTGTILPKGGSRYVGGNYVGSQSLG